MAAKLAQQHVEIGLVSNGIDRPTRFYRDLMGFPVAGSIEIPNVGTITRFQAGDSIIRVLVPVEPAADPAGQGGFQAVVGIRYLALRIANLSEMVDRIATAGFAVPVPVRALRPGVRVALVEDGDGNTIELMEESAA
ncbi:VOC family protein [Sphingomonas colocasiae]|uniref:VOC family protein n=1 Tax=Sphingomonas colocasiae TaxID=1848973 RepID=A0ABS7PKC8_9SPHN|nr:VOC family protein [Sphingomonas colocasiae]MBY8821753.1 VOC family protein [Sphingomonas colocasiae]